MNADVPLIIYLQLEEDPPTWCSDQINDDDIAYWRVVEGDDLGTLEQLREDALLVRQALINERDQRELMKARYPRKAVYWQSRIDDMTRAIEAHKRSAQYIASTAPHNRLVSHPAVKQANLFENGDGS